VLCTTRSITVRASILTQKRLFALRWLREKEVEREHQEQKMRSYVRLTFWAAVAAVVAGIAGVLVTWFAR
jgi:hypothetical protein